MGAYSPAPVLTQAIQDQVMAEIVRPTMAEMVRRGTPFQGVLYAGLMIDGGRARLVEYNVRFGDPECQVLMLRLGAQALDLIQACAQGRLDRARVVWAEDHALCVVMAAAGYPGTPRTGTVIGGLEGLPADSMRMMFHAGTRAEGGRVLAAGGRVLCPTGRGASLAEARARAYALAGAVDWPDGFFRGDIGWRAPG
jgi:phosphoribosylamine--glycine ligase